MKRVRYKGENPAIVYSLNLDVVPGGVYDVPDTFSNTQFEDVPDVPIEKKPVTKREDDKN